MGCVFNASGEQQVGARSDVRGWDGDEKEGSRRPRAAPGYRGIPPQVSGYAPARGGSAARGL